jgi:hypothetical protein
MRKSGSQHIGTALKEFLSSEEYRPLRERLTEAAVIEALGELLGEQRHYVRQTVIHHRKLHIAVTSAVMRSELVMRRRSLVSQINMRVGENVIDEITVR